VASPCLGCRAQDVRPLLDFGEQPPSNRFERAGEAGGDAHRLLLGQCGACGLLQLMAPMPPAMAKTRYAWLTYNEPESHLDGLVETLRALPGIGPASRIVGVTYKDDSTLARFNRLGHAETYRYDPAGDLGLADPCTGLESIQAAFDAATTARLAATHGQADLLLVRHILEHAHDPHAFLASLRRLVKPGGYLLFEMPDSGKFVRACDYPFVWEEHITYFCAPTLAAFFEAARVELHRTIVHPYPLEDSLLAIVRNTARPAVKSARAELPALLAEGREFGRRFPETRVRLQALLEGWRKQGRRVALFGAGHLAAKFANFYGLGGLLDCVIDDNPNKQALLMPGSRLPVKGSAELERMGLCLLTLNPESEQKVRARYADYLARGGRFLSVFALSPASVYKEAA
jgi:SAM-dependent methyltransferase